MPTELELQEAERKRLADAADAKRVADAAKTSTADAAKTLPDIPAKAVPHVPQPAKVGQTSFPKTLSGSGKPDKIVNDAAEEAAARADGYTNAASEEPFIVTIGRCNACRQPIFEGGIGAQGYTYHPDVGKDRTGVYLHNDCGQAKAKNFHIPERTEGVTKRIDSLEPTELKSALMNEPAVEGSPTGKPPVTPARPGAQRIG